MHTSKNKIYYLVLKISYSFLQKVQLLIMQINNYRKLSFILTYAHNSDPSGRTYVKRLKQRPLNTTRTL
jgi:hypothetical protein